MSEEFGNDIITISDEEGNDYTLEHFDTIEVDGTFYMACLPTDIDEEDEDYGMIILEVVGDGELASVEDEEVLQEVYDLFMERLYDEDDEDNEDEDYAEEELSGGDDEDED